MSDKSDSKAKIIRVDKPGKGYEGFTLIVESDEEEIACPFWIEGVALCCENFGVKYDNNSLEKLLGWEIVSITSKTTSHTDNKDYGSETFTVKCSKNNEDVNFLVEIFNEHNGYYEHLYKATYFKDGVFRIDEDKL